MSIFSRAFTGLTNVLSSGVRMAASPRLLGRYSGGAGAAQEIQLGAGLSFVGDTLTFTASGGATWGAITGTLASQTDLTAAFAAASHVHTTDSLTTSNGSAAAATGKLGQTIEDTSGVVALTDGIASDVASVILTPGQWLIFGKINFSADTATVTKVEGDITSGLPPNDSATHLPWSLSADSAKATTVISPRLVRFDSTFAATITFRLYATAHFSGGDVEVESGEIFAIRVR